MFKNYFKLAIRVLSRKKFFTFISLFGISFTLMILMLITAFIDNEVGANKPMTNQGNMLFVNSLSMILESEDSLMLVDTNYIDGAMKLDTTFKSNDTRSSSTSSLSHHFLSTYLSDLQPSKTHTFYCVGNSTDLYINSNKLTLEAIFTDAGYWEVFDFRFLEGKEYFNQQVENQEQVAVISEDCRKKYFGKENNVLGKTIEFENKQFKVIGVIADVKTNKPFIKSDLYIPYTNMAAPVLANRGYLGGFQAVYLSDNSTQRDLLRSELDKKLPLIPLPNPKEFNKLEITALTFGETYCRNIYYHENAATSYTVVTAGVVGLLLLFFLLPTLNLINVNVSRIMERASEIGVRKAFGAHSGNIMGQFVFENVILTLIGGVIGFLLALGVIKTINNSHFLASSQLSFNFRIFLYSLGVCLLFGVVSGIIPAYRMSKIHIVSALKNARTK